MNCTCNSPAAGNQKAREGAKGQKILDILNSIQPDLPARLLDGEGLQRLVRAAKLLPAEMSTFWGFETRLGDPQALMDILFEIRKGTPGPPLLAGHTPSALDLLCRERTIWEQLRTIAKKWTDPSHLFHVHIRNLWLEVDLAEATSAEDIDHAINQPNVFFGPEPEIGPETLSEVICIFMRAFGRSIPRRSAIQNFLYTLPQDAQVFQVGFMLTRKEDLGLRLCVNKVASQHITSWFGSIFSDSEADFMKPLIHSTADRCELLTFGFNLTENGIAPGIGVECYQDWTKNSSEQWRPLLEELVDKKLCLPEKARGVLAYQGITQSPLPERITGDMLYLHTYRKIHHLKLTLANGTISQAKAYLAVSRPGMPLTHISPDRAGTSNTDANQAWLSI